jgi:hypothetical protein
MEKAGAMYTLKSCALICLSRANSCRKYMFLHTAHRVSSLEHVQAFRYYVTHRNLRLKTTHSLINIVDVQLTSTHTDIFPARISGSESANQREN